MIYEDFIPVGAHFGRCQCARQGLLALNADDFAAPLIAVADQGLRRQIVLGHRAPSA